MINASATHTTLTHSPVYSAIDVHSFLSRVSMQCMQSDILFYQSVRLSVCQSVQCQYNANTVTK